MQPLGKSFAAGMNAGWYNTARTHKVFGFSVTVFGSAALVPQADRTFDIAGLGLQNIVITSPGGITSPTLAGENKSGPTVSILGPNPFYGVNDPNLPGSNYNNFNSLSGVQRANLANVSLPGGGTLGTTFSTPLGAGGALPTGNPLALGQPAQGQVNTILAGNFLGIQYNNTSFQMPQGLGVPVMPALAGVQAAIGLPKNIDLLIRFLPPIGINYNDGQAKVGYFGAGLKAEFKEWIPGFRLLPFDLAFVGGFTTLNSSVPLKLTKPSINPSDPNAVTRDGDPTVSYSGQVGEMIATGWNVGGVISKKFLFLTLYAGARYEMSYVTLKLKGNYPIVLPYYDAAGSPRSGTEVRALTDPLNLNYRNPNTLALTAGFRLKIAFLTLHADYTYANYQMLSAGLGFSIFERK